jgi:hypothetical protein
MTTVTTVGSSYSIDGKHWGPGPWLGLIHEINRRTDGEAFGSPEIVTDERGYVEVYPDFDVVMVGRGRQDKLVTVVSKTARAAAVLQAAAKGMGLEVEDR